MAESAPEGARASSRTAAMIAAYRARASERPEPLFRDPWAAGLAGEEGVAIATEHDRHFPHAELWVAVRTTWLDARVRATAEAGIAQVVLLGAGLDARAARLARTGLEFFEVDQAASQAEKRRRIAALDGYPLDAATTVTCDFESDDFLDRLSASGFRADRPALLLWEGVTPYLTEDAIRRTLDRVASGCHPESILVFDFIGRRLAEGSTRRAGDDGVRELVDTLGEPFRWGTNDPLPLLFEAGFRHVRTVSFDQACLELTGTYDRAREFRFQSFAVASRDRWLGP